MTSRLLTRKNAAIALTKADLDQPAVVAGRNRAVAYGGTPHIPLADTITAVGAIKLTARAAGLFLVSLAGLAAAAAAGDVVTWTVTTYTDAVAGTPLTLSANAAAFGLQNCYDDNSGAGITLTGASAGQVIVASAKTIGTAAVGDAFEWSGLAPISTGPVPYGQTFVCTLSITDTVAARAVTQLALSAFELP